MLELVDLGGAALAAANVAPALRARDVGDRELVVLNAFALGPWATGMAVSSALSDRFLVKSIEPDVGKLVATIELLGPRRPFLIAGYPPFLKFLCDTAAIDWSRYQAPTSAGATRSRDRAPAEC